MSLIAGVKRLFCVGALSLFSLNAMAAPEAGTASHAQLESLKIYTDSADEFAGSYLVDQHSVNFGAYVSGEGNVHFKFDIDGNFRELSFHIENTELYLTSGDFKVTDNERVLMYDTAKTLVDYVQSQEKVVLNDHVVVLVGTLSSWNQIELKQ